MNQNYNAWESDKIVSFYLKRNDDHIYPAEKIVFDKITDKKTKTILDIGIGTGRTTKFLFDKFLFYYGIDYSKKMIDASRVCVPIDKNNVSIEMGNVLDLSKFPDNFFDVVFFSYNGIDYFEDVIERRKAIDEIYRVLKKSGLYLFSTHNFYNIKNKYLFPSISLGVIKFIKEFIKYLIIPYCNPPYSDFINKNHVLFNDGALFFKLKTFYIKPEIQLDNLDEQGFKDITVYDLKGSVICNNYSKSYNHYYLYYSCYKK